MVNFYKAFVNCTSTDVTIEQVANHIDHIRKVAGIDHVGIGSDFDGVSGQLPQGLEGGFLCYVVECFSDVSKYPYLTAELIRRGYTDQEVIKVIGGNIIRVFHKVVDVANQLSSEPPNETIINYNFTAHNNMCRTTTCAPGAWC